MFSFPGATGMYYFTPCGLDPPYWIRAGMLRHDPQRVVPSEIPGSSPGCGSPRLIAACRVLRRRLAPRHPPCTLSSLTAMDHVPALRPGAPHRVATHRAAILVFGLVVNATSFATIHLSRSICRGPPAAESSPGPRSRTSLVEVNGFEPSTSGLQSRRSPAELHPRIRQRPKPMWWAQVDSNYRPRPYQGRALTN